MKNESYFKIFGTYEEAKKRLMTKKRCNLRSIFALVEHPRGFAIVDLKTAIEMGLGYEF